MRHAICRISAVWMHVSGLFLRTLFKGKNDKWAESYQVGGSLQHLQNGEGSAPYWPSISQEAHPQSTIWRVLLLDSCPLWTSGMPPPLGDRTLSKEPSFSPRRPIQTPPSNSTPVCLPLPSSSGFVFLVKENQPNPPVLLGLLNQSWRPHTGCMTLGK